MSSGLYISPTIKDVISASEIMRSVPPYWGVAVGVVVRDVVVALASEVIGVDVEVVVARVDDVVTRVDDVVARVDDVVVVAAVCVVCEQPLRPIPAINIRMNIKIRLFLSINFFPPLLLSGRTSLSLTLPGMCS
jgi:hypothetical protein